MEEEDLTIQVYRNTNTPSGIAHILLAGTAGNALTYISFRNQPFVFATTCLLFGHGMYGALIKTHTSLKWYPYLSNLYEWIRLGVKSFTLPLMNAHFGQLIGNDNFYVYSHILSGFAPLIYGMGRRYADTSLAFRSERVLGIVTLGNACSLAYIGATHESPIALSLAFWQMFIQNFPVMIERRIDTQRYDLETLGMSVFTVILVAMFRNGHPLLLNNIVGE